MPRDFWATDFIRSASKWMESRSALFGFLGVFCHSAFLPFFLALRVALREWQPFHLDLPDWPWWWQWKNPSSLWNVALVLAVPRPLVAGNRDCFMFCYLHPSPLHRSSLLWLHSTLCGAASCLPTFSHDPSTIACRGCAESIAFSPHYLTHE